MTSQQAPKRPPEDPTYWEIVWRQFMRQKLAVWSMWGVLGMLFLAIYVPLLCSNKPFLWKVDDGPWSSPFASTLFDRNFFESAVDIFFNSLFFPGTLLVIPVIVVFRKSRHLLRAERRPKRRQVIAISVTLWLAVLVGLLAFPSSGPKLIYPILQDQYQAQGKTVSALYPPLPYSFRDSILEDAYAPVSLAHPLGTDKAGRDVFTRLLYGTRISLTVGVFAVLLYIIFGTMIGSIAGYYGGRVDVIIQRIIEVFLSIPSLFLILTLAAFIEKRSIFHIMFIIAIVRWTTPARLVRSEFLRLRNLDFVQAARAAGFSEATIIFKHILPNAVGPVLVSATFGVAAAILIESTMSFLGLGDITVPSWGQILSSGRTTGLWTLILAPGFAIFLTVSLLNLLGEGVRDALDPKLR